MYLRNYFAKIACRYYYVSFLPKSKSLWKKKKSKKIVIVKNNIAIRIAGKVSRYIDASMNRANPNDVCVYSVGCLTVMSYTSSSDSSLLSERCRQRRRRRRRRRRPTPADPLAVTRWQHRARREAGGDCQRAQRVVRLNVTTR